MANITTFTLVKDQCAGDMGEITMNPESVSPPAASWRDSGTDGIAASRMRVTSNLNPPTTSRTTFRPKITFSLPLERSDADGDKSYSNVARVEVQFVIPGGSVHCERQNLLKMFISTMNAEWAQTLVEDLEAPW